MEYYNKILCVTYVELTDGNDPIIAGPTLRQSIHRGRIQCARRGGGEGQCALIVYASLPEKYKQKFVEKIGDPEELVKEEAVSVSLKIDAEARAWFEGFEYSLNGVQTHLSQQKVEEYTLNASVLNHLIADMQDKEMLTKALKNCKRDLWPLMLQMLEQMRERYGHTLPKSLARLKEKVSQYKKEGYSALLSGKLGNQNTLKITEDAARKLIALKRSRVPVLTDSQIFDTFNAEAESMGWKPLKSIRSLKTWLSQPDIEPLWHDAVHGEMASQQRYKRLHKTELPSRRDSLWYGDGTKLNLYYRDEDGKVRTINVYEVMDAATEVLLGFHISETEDYEAQYHAYRMAVQVSGHKPYEIVHDNQGGHKKANAAGMLDKICHVHRTTAPYNGESKTIESAFGRFQMEVLHKDWRFTGQNVTTKKATSKPNVEFIEANKDKLYTLEELKDAYVKARTEWNEAVRPGETVSRWEMYQKSVNEEAMEVTPRDMIDMFWVRTDKAITFTNGGLELTVKGQKYTYEVYSTAGVPDHEWRRRNTWRKFIVEYDPYDMTSVRLYSEDKAGELRFERVAGTYLVIHRALQDQTEGEMAFIKQEQEANLQDRIERQVAAKEIEYEHGVAPEQHGLSTPKLKGVTKEVQDQIDKRTRKYSREPEELQLGRRTKGISLMDWMEVQKQESSEDVKRRAAGKL